MRANLPPFGSTKSGIPDYENPHCFIYMSEEKKVKAAPIPTIHLPEGHPMAGLIDSIPIPPAAGDLVEGTIIAMNRGRVYIDLHPFGTGLIYGREYLNAADVLRKANQGDIISAKIVDPAGREDARHFGLGGVLDRADQVHVSQLSDELLHVCNLVGQQALHHQ